MEIPLRHGVCLLDDEDWPTVRDYWWWSQLSGSHAVFHVSGRLRQPGWTTTETQGPTVLMHRLILGRGTYQSDPVDVDHVNRNGLDNRRSNLRVATRAENLANTSSRGGTSKFKGVTLDKARGLWIAQITVDGVHAALGRFVTEEEAAAAYNRAAVAAWGEFAHRNDVSPDVVPVPSGQRPRTHCRRGHELTGANVIRRPGRGLECRACANESRRRRLKPDPLE